MPVTENIGRRHCIPIINTRGTHYEVGFDVGRTFAAIIHDFLENASVLNDVYLPRYESPEGRKNYDNTLEAVKKNFPQYIRELEGTADGAKVPFYKLFLLHLDEIIMAGAGQANGGPKAENCSSICINQPDNEIIGHTEDALSVTLNRFYYVSAHIISEKPEGKWGVKEERFTSLCYAGHLPGYTMNYNHHGLIFTINTLCAKKLLPGRIPRHFLTRALLAAENFEQAQKILRDTGCGAADGCSFNMTFLNQEGDRLFHNIEMSPAYENNESGLNVLTISPGEISIHCNTYLRANIEEVNPFLLSSSKHRLCTLKSYKEPNTKKDVIEMLGDETGEKYSVFRDKNPEDVVKTIAVGIFDCTKKTLSIYADNPRRTEPTVVLPLYLKKDICM